MYTMVKESHKNNTVFLREELWLYLSSALVEC
jgi:hypothetical protein